LIVDRLKKDHQLSERAACRVINMSRSVYHYQPDTEKDMPVISALQGLLEDYPAYGFLKLFTLLRQAGYRWNHKRVHRIYCALGLNMRRKGKKRLPSRYPCPLDVPAQPNTSWSMDFMSDSLYEGRSFRTFNVIDDYNREVLAIEIDLSLPAQRVIRTLERIVEWKGYPHQLRCDNGPEFISLALAQWAEEHGVHLEFIKPGTPTQNAYVERFNRTYRTEVLDFYVFHTLTEVREITEKWMQQYNYERPHEALNNQSPMSYKEANFKLENSNLAWH